MFTVVFDTPTEYLLQLENRQGIGKIQMYCSQSGRTFKLHEKPHERYARTKHYQSYKNKDRCWCNEKKVQDEM